MGRFLSVDPVTALDNGDMRHFNRYAYGYNNPYKFTDPDGRCPVCLIPFVIGLITYSEPANAPAPGEQPVSASSGEALAAALPPARLLVPLRMAANAGKTHTTYTREKGDGTTYGGRTSGKGTPEQQVAARTAKPDHQAKTAEGYGPARVDKNTTNPDAARGREQQLIDQNGGAQSQGGTSGNKINGVAPTNPKSETYQTACKKEFGC
ncbi:hypothetical protein GCM10027266_15750 [Arenimonas alkanexedens]